MAIIDFPANPTVGQTFTAPNGVAYKWNGVMWVQDYSVGVPLGVEFMFSEHLLAAPTNFLQTALPLPPFKRLTVQVFYVSADGTNRQAGINIGGIATNNYATQLMQAQGASTGGVLNNPATFWVMPGGWVAWLTLEFAYSGGGVHGSGHMQTIYQNGTRFTNTLALDVPGTVATINTIRMTYVDLTNMAAGSFMRAFTIL